MSAIRLLAVSVLAGVSADGALAQVCDTPGDCGNSPLFGTGALFAPNKHLGRLPDANTPLCATKTYPISDWAFIRKYCGPTLNPGTCYGFYPTKWRRWEEACPKGAAGCGTNANANSVAEPMPMLHPVAPPQSTPIPAPMPIPPAKEPEPIPAPLPISQNPIAPVPLPPISVPMPIFSAMPAVSSVETVKPIPNDPTAPLKMLPNVVVPPVREYPEKSRN